MYVNIYSRPFIVFSIFLLLFVLFSACLCTALSFLGHYGGSKRIPTCVFIKEVPGGNPWLVEHKTLHGFMSMDYKRMGRLDYINNANLQFWAVASSFIDMRQLQLLIASLQAVVRRAMSWGNPWKTTRFLCFKISQHRSRSSGWRIIFAM